MKNTRLSRFLCRSLSVCLLALRAFFVSLLFARVLRAATLHPHPPPTPHRTLPSPTTTTTTTTTTTITTTTIQSNPIHPPPCSPAHHHHLPLPLPPSTTTTTRTHTQKPALPRRWSPGHAQRRHRAVLSSLSLSSLSLPLSPSLSSLDSFTPLSLSLPAVPVCRPSSPPRLIIP